jgi:hypothetical protein
MVKRQWWLKRIEDAWRTRGVVWLRGVRRVGKTSLARSLSKVEYFDCELPRVRRAMEDPEAFLEKLSGKRVVFDEIHRLAQPSELLKIAADHFPSTRVLATGSSTLGASKRFRDTLTGRKVDLWLTPMIQRDLADFDEPDLAHRLLHGGLPPFFLAKEPPEADFHEWMDSYWARDVQELFRLQRRTSFQRFVELLLSQSGGMFEATRFAGPCEVSRTTIMNYLAVLEATAVALVLRPFGARRANEIVSAPKVYGFDTGFVCAYRGWTKLRPEDLGRLWEHYVLNELSARIPMTELRYWRDKQGHEIDLVWTARERRPVAIECKWSARDFDPAGLQTFARAYPKAEILVVAPDARPAFTRKVAGVPVHALTLEALVERIAPTGGQGV